MRILCSLFTAFALGLVLAAPTWNADLRDFDLLGQKAHAKPGGGNGNGGGNAGGNAGGNGGGKGGGHGKGGVGQGPHAAGQTVGQAGKAQGKSESGKSHAGKSHGLGLGLSKDAVSGVAADKKSGLSASRHGLSASSLGRLNAAHASDRARERAAPHSAVGLIGQFSEAERAAIEAAIAGDEEGYDQAIAEASNALATAANKDINDDVVGAVNDLLGIDVEDSLDGTSAEGTDVEGDIADQAAAEQAGETDNGLGGAKSSAGP